MEDLKIKEWLDPNDNYKYQKCSFVATGSGFIEIPDGAELLTASGKELVFWKNEGQYSFHTINSTEWDKAENGLCDLSDYMDSSVKIVWQREQIQQEQGLISGADAELVERSKKFITPDHLNRFQAAQAHLESKPVQFMTANGDFIDITDNSTVGIFATDGGYSFRLKPRTITLSLEIPAPFEPKDGEIYYFINSSNLKGYGFNKFANDGDDECLTFYGAWDSEEKIKQVVAALRGIKG